MRLVFFLPLFTAIPSSVGSGMPLGIPNTESAPDYSWTITWTAPQSCSSWPCPYAYDVTAPQWMANGITIPSFEARCDGSVDSHLSPCEPSYRERYDAGPSATITGNFSTFETSGVGAGVLNIWMTWFSSERDRNMTLKGETPLENSQTGSSWTISPAGCPLSEVDCSMMGWQSDIEV